MLQNFFFFGCFDDYGHPLLFSLIVQLSHFRSASYILLGMTMYEYEIACYTIMDVIWQSEFYMNHREVFYDIKRIEAIWLHAFLSWSLLIACTIYSFQSNLKRFWWVDGDRGNLSRLKIMTKLWTQSSSILSLGDLIEPLRLMAMKHLLLRIYIAILIVIFVIIL